METQIMGYCSCCGNPIYVRPPAVDDAAPPAAPSSAIKRPRLDKALARCRKRVRTAMNQLTGELTQP